MNEQTGLRSYGIIHSLMPITLRTMMINMGSNIVVAADIVVAITVVAVVVILYQYRQD